METNDEHTLEERAFERKQIMQKSMELEHEVKEKDLEIQRLRQANKGLSKVTETLLETNKKLTNRDLLED